LLRSGQHIELDLMVLFGADGDLGRERVFLVDGAFSNRRLTTMDTEGLIFVGRMAADQ
jgi:hypothetical protein